MKKLPIYIGSFYNFNALFVPQRLCIYIGAEIRQRVGGHDLRFS